MYRIPVSRPSIGPDEQAEVADALRRERLSMGEYVARFEQAFADWILTPGTSHVSDVHALATSSGTTALHLAVAALGAGPGDEVLVPACTFVATANAVAYAGAKPVVVDVDPDTWTMDPNDAARKVTRRTVGVVPVHLYGVPADMDRLLALAMRHDLWVVEDCAEAVGTYRYTDDRHVGLLGHAGVFSFYANKTMVTGEGGMLVTRDREIRRRAAKLRGQGMSARRYYHDTLGYNYRMTDIQAALGLPQIKRLNALVNRRREIAQRYRNALSGHVGLQAERPGWFTGWWHPVVTVAARDEVAHALALNNIETRPAFVPMDALPMYETDLRYRCAVAAEVGRRGLVLPCFDAISDEAIDQCVSVVREAVVHV